MSPGPNRWGVGYQENVEMVRAAFPDFDIRTEHSIVTNEDGSSHWPITGTHDGPRRIEPTGTDAEFPGVLSARTQGEWATEAGPASTSSA